MGPIACDFTALPPNIAFLPNPADRDLRPPETTILHDVAPERNSTLRCVARIARSRARLYGKGNFAMRACNPGHSRICVCASRTLQSGLRISTPGAKWPKKWVIMRPGEAAPPEESCV